MSKLPDSASHSPFPQSDPFAPFDPNECLVRPGKSSSIGSFGSPLDRWNELRRLIPTLTEAPPVVEVPLMLIDYVPESAEELGIGLVNKFERLKRKRKMKQGLYVAGFLAVAVAFLGFAGFQFIWNQIGIVARHETAAAISSSATNLTKSNAPNVRSIGGQKAPRTNGDEPVFVFPTLAINEAPTEPGVEPLDPDAITPIPMKQTSDKLMVPSASGTSRADWAAAMMKAKESVHRADFVAFHKQIELALPLSTTEEMQAKHARLDQLGQLYAIFIKSLREAKSNMRGAETLSIGKLRVGIVEVKDDVLIVRIDGTNKPYAWDQLPPGIAMAIADLTLSDQDPTDLAARAVYFSLSPARNELFEKRVTDWFEKSVGKKTIRKDLVQALSDTYE